MVDVYHNGPVELRLGRWQDVLADVEVCDAVITDPPFSLRQHDGYRSGSDFINAKRKGYAKARAKGGGIPGTHITYAPINEAYVGDFCSHWCSRVRQWLVIFGDHVSRGWWETELHTGAWVVFAPVPWVKPNPCPRFHADGPANACEWITIARPSGKMPTNRYSRPGWYGDKVENSQSTEKILVGQKPLSIMRALVRHYSEPGWTIVEPHAGSGTTLLAAAIEGRRCIGAEMDPETYAKAVKRLEAGWTPDLFGGG